MTETELVQKMNMLGGLMQDLADQKAVFEEQTKDLTDLIEDLKTELKEEFLNRKESMTCKHLVAQYRKGATRWDSVGLNRYLKHHPELEKYRKVGDPTVAFFLPKETVEE